MDHQTRAQCQHCLDLLVGQEEGFARAFFPLLFQRGPELKVLFPGNIDDHAEQVRVLYRLMTCFAGSEVTLIAGLRLIGFRMAMRGLGIDYAEVLANTLIGTLKRQMGSSWQGDFAHAWQIAADEALDALALGAELMAA
ncbi:globin [Aliiroseovarius sp. PrR006]|uniref:globin n=1 Tax=Aliiroseovarius sp. PrR006 TaxID=2706883 RepID=UPI0013D74B2C|nr:globin [Aliiroseovarius sp. PrR006]NDW51874.1 globin [Aliiroseovarius sp. PrR006]